MLVAIMLVASCTEVEPTNEKRKMKYRLDYKKPNFIVSDVNLTIDLNDQETTVTNKMKIKRADYADKDAALFLDGKNQDLVSIDVDGKKLDASQYELSKAGLTIPKLPDGFEMIIVSKNKPQDNTELFGLYKADDVYLTQCESHGFQNITYYPDRPDIMPVFTTKLIADKKHPVLLSNGDLVESGELPDNKHFAVWHDHSKKPCYLFAVVFGDLAVKKDTFTTKSGKVINLEMYVPQKDIEKTYVAMDALKKAMKWDEDVFGREYDLKTYMVVGTPKFNAGAMENKGLNIFNDVYMLADKDIATDSNYSHVYGVIGHEYFHNWTGNRITLRDWFELSLKEGLTVYRDQEFSSDIFSRTIERIENVNLIKSHQFREDSGPLAHPIRPDSYIEMKNFYTSTVYNKGAEVIRALRTVLGDAQFFKGMDLYFKKYDGHAITCDDFISAFEEANGLDLTQFRLWYAQAGTPVLDVSDSYDEKNHTYTLKIKQTIPDTPGQANKKPMHIPVKIGLIGKDSGKSIEFKYDSKNAREAVLNVKKPEEEFILHNVSEKPVPSLLRDFSAPVKLNYSYTNEDLLFLLENDDNEFNSCNAGRQYAENLIIKLSKDLDENKPLQVPSEYINVIKALLANKSDKELLAITISLPSEQSIYEELDEINPENIYKAKEFIRKTVGEKLKDDFIKIFNDLDTEKPYKFNQKDSADRVLKSVCLSYIFEADQKLAVEIAKKHIDKADNLTDRLIFLSKLLNADDDNIYQESADQFYKKWSHEDIIVNKWLALQAMSKRADTTARVKELMEHKAFDITTPNKSYSLIGPFIANTQHFHAIDGSGYDFVKDVIIELDKTNPYVGARFAKSFSNWRKFEPKRREMMKQVLMEIKAHPDLSKATAEIIDASLKETVSQS